jgi:long-subunit fatty acid transport protein
MKKLIFSLIAILSGLSVLAGGIVTNTNQSAAFVRMPAQDAAIGIHAAYHNPAGLTKLAEGFHLQLNNQSIFQTKEIESTYEPLNNKTYVGDVKAPLFPSFYAAYKTGKMAFSLGFNPIGGGGGAEYKTGLPSFEQAVSSIPASLTAAGIPTNEYSADIYFSGSSVYWGLQFGISYEVNEMISLYAGARYIMAKNTYEGHIHGIMINPIKDLRALGQPNYTGTMVSATQFFTDLSEASTAASGSAASGATGMQPLIAGGAGDLTFAQAEGAGIITSTQRAQMEGGLLAFGVPQASINAMTLTIAQGTYTSISNQYASAATVATYNAAATKDMDVDAEQTGNTIAPILGAHLTLMEGALNIGLKYEFKTPLELTNATVIDGTGMFPDGHVSPNEMPSLLSVGVDYKIMDNLSLAVGYHQYFDKSAKYGKTDATGAYITNETLMDNNNWELAVGLEYAVNDNFLLSGGWLKTSTGVTLAYQTDMSYSLNTNTIALGGKISLSPAMAIDLGVMKTFYEDGEKDFTEPMAYKELYRKKTFTAGIGFSYTIGANKAE